MQGRRPLDTAGCPGPGLPPIKRLWVLPPAHVTELGRLRPWGGWTLASGLAQSATCWRLREQV